MKLRLTRSHYKRKLVMFGVSIFMSLSLTATGFAAWVLSNDVTKVESGMIEVGAVTESNIDIENIGFLDTVDVGGTPTQVTDFKFEPLATDTSGRVRYDGITAESLKLRLGWTVTNYSKVGEHTIKFSVPAGIKNAVDAGYITMPEGFAFPETDVKTETQDEKTYYYVTYTVPKIETSGENDGKFLKYTVNTGDDPATVGYTEQADSVSFELTLEFGWGEKFNEMNPGLYYDTDDAGKAVAYEDIKKELDTFKATVHGVSYDAYVAANTEELMNKLLADNPIGKYYITLSATVA